jgi:hypothetical protein
MCPRCNTTTTETVRKAAAYVIGTRRLESQQE